MRSEKAHLPFVPSLRSFSKVAFETVPMFRLIDDDPFSSFQGRLASTSSFNTFLLQAINGVMSLALCPQVVSQAPQHFRSSEKKATCEGCFARQSICSVFSFLSGMSRAVLPRKFSKVDVDHGRIPAWTYHSLSFHLCSKLIESVRMMPLVV